MELTTARITNSITSNAFQSFNKWGGTTYEDILSNYPQNIIDNCWWSLSRSIIENFEKGRGTFIKGFGTFIFTHSEYLLDGVTNQYDKEYKVRHPVFIVSPEFVDYLKPGQYNKSSGIIYYTQRYNFDVPVCKVNYALCSYGINLSKEEYVTICSTIIKSMGEQIRRGVFKEKIMPGLGTLILKGNILGMKFNEDIFQNNKLKTEKMRKLKGTINLAMETCQANGWRQINIKDIDEAERYVRPETAVITHISKNGDKWLKNNLNVDVAEEITEGVSEVLAVEKPELKQENLVDQRYYRIYPKQNLGGLKIAQDVLEGIINKKFIIMREMKVYDHHGDGIILKYDFINAMQKANPHFRLRRELIEKIVSLYVGSAPSIKDVNYYALMKVLEEDIKSLIKTEYKYFPIDKYKNTITKENRRTISAYAFSKESGNLSGKAVSAKDIYNKKINPSDREVKQDIIDIYNILSKLRKSNRMISFLELKEIFESNSLSFSKIQILKIIKSLGIENPNSFNYADFIYKVKSSPFIHDRNQ